MNLCVNFVELTIQYFLPILWDGRDTIFNLVSRAADERLTGARGIYGYDLVVVFCCYSNSIYFMDVQNHMKLSLVLVALVLTGCAIEPVTSKSDFHFEKPGANDQDFKVDIGQCKAQALAGTNGVLHGGTVMIAEACLQGKGWNKVPN